MQDVGSFEGITEGIEVLGSSVGMCVGLSTVGKSLGLSHKRQSVTNVMCSVDVFVYQIKVERDFFISSIQTFSSGARREHEITSTWILHKDSFCQIFMRTTKRYKFSVL